MKKILDIWNSNKSAPIQTFRSATDEEYKKYAGIDNNEKLIERLAELKLSNSEIFINSFSNPRALVLGSIEDIAYSKTKKLELKLHNARNTKIMSSIHKFNDSHVNWSTWRQFNSLKDISFYEPDMSIWYDSAVSRRCLVLSNDYFSRCRIIVLRQ